jgi:AcrR family transcriptional regulator
LLNLSDKPITEKQRRVLDAAMDVFAEQGYSATSTSEIAKRAGVAAGTVFRFYRTKKELLIGVVAPLFRRFVAPSLVKEFGDLLGADYEDLEAFLRTVVEDRLEFVRRHRRVVRIALQETPLHPELRTLWNDSVIHQLKPLVLAAVERFQERDLIIDLPPETVARTVSSLFAGYAVQRFFVERERDWDDAAEVDAMVLLLSRALAPLG